MSLFLPRETIFSATIIIDISIDYSVSLSPSLSNLSRFLHISLPSLSLCMYCNDKVELVLVCVRE